MSYEIGQKGSPEWAINRFRSDALVSLMNDLVEREKDGLEDSQCQHVQQCLGKLANATSIIPDNSFWRSTILKEMQQFADIYEKWNSHSGPEAPRKRRVELKKLQTQRNKLATVIRKNQHILHNELDLALIDSTYKAMMGLVAALPEIFKDLSSSIRYYNKTMSKHRKSKSSQPAIDQN